MSDGMQDSNVAAVASGAEEQSSKNRGGGGEVSPRFVNWGKLIWKPPTVRVMELKRTSAGGRPSISDEDPPDYVPLLS